MEGIKVRKPPDVPAKTPPEARDPAGEKVAGHSKLEPLRTLLEGWLPYRKPAPRPDIIEPNGDAGREGPSPPSAGDRAEGSDAARKDGAGGGEASEVQIDNAKDLQAAAGREEGMGGGLAREVQDIGATRRTPNGEHVGSTGSWEEVNDRPEPPAQPSEDREEPDGQAQGAR